MTRQTRAILLALLAVLFWSTAGSAFKLTLRYLRPAEMLVISALAATAVLLLLSAREGSLRTAFRAKAGQWLTSALMGFINPFLYYTVLFIAYDRLLAQEAVVLNYLWPVLLVLLSIPMLRQRITWLQIGGILVSFLGTMVIATRGALTGLHFADPVGAGLAMVSALIWALYWILNLRDPRASLPKLLLNFSFGTFYATAYLVATTGLRIPGPEAIGGSIYIGLFEMGITFAVWLAALKNAPDTAMVSNLIYISPVISLFWVSLTVGEPILVSTLLGLVLILGGIGIQKLAGPGRSRPA